MEIWKIIAYVFLLTGLVDVVVVPRILIHIWTRRGDIQPSQVQVIRVLRIGGGILILIGMLFYFRVITVV